MICPGCGVHNRYRSKEITAAWRRHECAYCRFAWATQYDPRPLKARPVSGEFPFIEHRTMAEVMKTEKAA